MLPVNTYSFQIPASGAFPLQVTGRYFRVQSATGAFSVTGDQFGPMGGLNAGQGLKLRDKDPVFQRLTFNDLSGAANNLTVIIADADFVDATILGSVNVIDGGKARTLSNIVGVCGAQWTAQAALYAQAGVWNPAGSGKRVIVKSIRAALSAAGDMYACIITGALANLLTPTTLLASGVAYAGAAKVTSAQVAGSLGVSAIGTFSLPASQTQQFTLDEPFVLKAGYGMALQPALVNVGLACFFTFWEEADV